MTQKKEVPEKVEEKAPEKKEKKVINGPKEFKKFRLIKVGHTKEGKAIIERDGNKPLKVCKMLQRQADELNAHRENTLIEYKLK